MTQLSSKYKFYDNYMTTIQIQQSKVELKKLSSIKH